MEGGDGADDFYDEKLFHGATFADLPKKWPFLVLNSTDMSRAAHFSFVQEDFDLLCSDLLDVKISRAVASSSAVPFGLSPLTFKNYPNESCGFVNPQWVSDALKAGPDKDPKTFNRAVT